MKQPKPKKCKVCATGFKPWSSTQTVCSPKCAVTLSKQKEEAKLQKHLKKRKEEIKPYKRKLADAQPIFNELRRLQEFKWFKDRGLEPVCISCQNPLGGDQWCAGHLKTAGNHTNTRYDPLNVWLQHNKRCNMALSGDTDNYKLGLIARFGEEEGNRIIEHCETECKKIREYSDEELKKMKAEWRRQIRELKCNLT